ncbi:MAG TPA: Gfo/Idh/MocA family oxidoreductase [Patescibacteria group bacterium]
MKKNNSLHVAVIGVGNMGKNHLRAYSQIPFAKLVAVSDVNKQLGETLANKYHAKYYSDYKEMIKQEKIDALSICVPTSLHFVVASYCIAKKINILLEKPIATTLEEAKKILQLASKNRISLLVGHIERFNPAVKKVKELIKKGDLGKITAITARRVGGFPPQIKDANIAVDLAIHDIDIVNYLLDEIPQSITVNKQKNHITKREDSVEFFLKFKRASAYIQANWISPVKIRKLTITGSEGYLEMDYITQKIEFFKSNYNKFKQASKNYSDYILLFSEPDIINISVAKKEPLTEELTYFLESIHKKEKINSKFAQEALKIALFE